MASRDRISVARRRRRRTDGRRRRTGRGREVDGDRRPARVARLARERSRVLPGLGTTVAPDSRPSRGKPSGARHGAADSSHPPAGTCGGRRDSSTVPRRRADRAGRVRAGRSLAARGAVVIFDRFPLAGVRVGEREMDGPRIRPSRAGRHAPSSAPWPRANVPSTRPSRRRITSSGYPSIPRSPSPARRTGPRAASRRRPGPWSGLRSSRSRPSPGSTPPSRSRRSCAPSGTPCGTCCEDHRDRRPGRRRQDVAGRAAACGSRGTGARGHSNRRGVRAPQAPISRWAQPAAAARFAARHPGLLVAVATSLLRAPIASWHRGRILLLVLKLGARLDLLRQQLPSEVTVIVDEGWLHRALNVYAWRTQEPSARELDAYLDRAPLGGVIVLVAAEPDIVRARAARRGLPDGWRAVRTRDRGVPLARRAHPGTRRGLTVRHPSGRGARARPE